MTWMQLKRSCNNLLLKNLLKKYHQRNTPNSPLKQYLEKLVQRNHNNLLCLTNLHDAFIV